MVHDILTPPAKKSHKCLYYSIFALVLINMVLSITLGAAMIFVYNNTEPTAKRVTSDYIMERLSEIRANPKNEDLINELSRLSTDIMKDAAPGLTKEFMASLSSSIIPNDVFSIVDFILNYNFNYGAELFAATMDATSKSFMINPDYEYGAQYVSIISSVSDIVSNVEPLSNNTNIPEATTLLGQTLYNLPMVFVNSLTEEVWKDAATSCTILANRLYFTDFSGTYETPYGLTSYDVNENVKPVFSQIHDICFTLASSPPISLE